MFAILRLRMCAIATLLVSISAIAQVPTGSPGLPIFSGKSQKSAANTLTDSASVVKVSLVQAADSASANGDLVVAVRLSIAQVGMSGVMHHRRKHCLAR